MLIEFRVENHRSLRDEQVLTLEAAPVGDESDPRPRTLDGHDVALLPAAALYGANASGKSNVLSALSFMRDAVLDSYRRWIPGGGVPRAPFAWGGMRQKPSTFEISLLIAGTKYQYGFVVNDDGVDEEWLFTWMSSGKQVVFEREGDRFKLSEHQSKPSELVQEATRSNALFLSVASQHNHPLSSLLYTWFRDIRLVNVVGTGLPNAPRQSFYSRIFGDNPNLPTEVLKPYGFDANSDDILGNRIRQLLRNADVGVVDVRITNGEEPQSEYRSPRIQLKHQTDDDESWIDLKNESQGTQMLLQLADPVFRALATGGLLLVDELESSLHPNLGLSIVEMFNCPKTNPSHAQIIFSTYDTNLLGTTLGQAPLRRDQIWFTEKNADGASRLYPLTDYKPGKVENLERGYLQGRYGAIPFLGNFTRIAE